MFGAFPKNGRPWFRSQHWKTHGWGAWPYPYCLLDLSCSCSQQSCGKVCLSSNHPIKLVPTQIYMFSAHGWGLPNPWQAMEQNLTWKNQGWNSMAIVIPRRVWQWKIMWQSVFIIKPPNKTCSHTNIYVLDLCLRPYWPIAGLGLEASIEQPMVEEPGHTGC